jgi:hypothetical protein
MTLALVFAMSGGAYAASKYVISSTKQIKPSVLASLKGANGKTGPAGAQGPARPAGQQGPQGPKGENGTAGKEGPAGSNGQSVASIALAKGNSNCKEGGSEFKTVSGTTFACNGEPASGGGFPKTLPAGQTETGAWSFSTNNESIVVTSFSFSIPLKEALGESQVHYISKTGNELVSLEEEAPSVECPGNVNEPTAEPGNLCVYEAFTTGVEKADDPSTHDVLVAAFVNIFPPASGPPDAGGSRGSNTSGAGLQFSAEGAGATRLGWGTWAVTAEGAS